MMLILAHILSALSFPYVLAAPGSFLVLFKQTNDLWISFLWATVIGLFTILILVFELVGMKMGKFSNFDISKRKQRTPFYLFVLLVLSAFIITVFVFRGPIELFQGGLATFIGISIILLVNKKKKASVHVASVSGLLLTVAYMYGNLFYLILLLIPVIAWARVKTKNHTVSETLWGALVGFIITLIAYIVVKYIHG